MGGASLRLPGGRPSQAKATEEQHKEAELNATQAEEVASHAMKAAEEAVRDEMEATAVTKETKKALEKALAGLKDLGISFAEVDERTAMERAKVMEQNKVLAAASLACAGPECETVSYRPHRVSAVQLDAQRAVTEALEAEDVTGALASVEVSLRYPSRAAEDVPLAASAKVDAVRKTGPSVVSRQAIDVCNEQRKKSEVV